MDKRRKSRKFVLEAVLLLSLAGFLLRLVQRKVSLGADGMHTSKLMWPLVLIAVLAVLFAVWVAFGAKKRAGFRVNQQPSAALLLILLAALLLIGASVVRIFAMRGIDRVLIGAVGLLGALGLTLFSLQTIAGKHPNALFSMGFTLSLILKLIPEFRTWSTDPVISDYCFRLFAMICMMFAAFHLGGFALESGKRRMMIFWCCAGAVFSAISVADGGVADVMTYGAYAIFLSAELWEMLARPRKRRRLVQPAPEAEG